MCSQSPKKILYIQGLRGYAFLLIFIHHCRDFLGFDRNLIFGYFGHFGVSLFLFISGYLAIKQAKCDNNGIYEKLKLGFNIAKKRLRKFFSLHLFTLLLSIPFFYKVLFFVDSWDQWLYLFLNLFLIHAFYPIGYFSFNSVSWYLSLFLFISFTTPFFTRYFVNLKNKNDLKIPIAIFLTIWSFQFIWTSFWMGHPFALWIIYVFPLIRMLDFILGMNISLFEDYLNKKIQLKYILYCGLIISCLLVYYFYIISEYFNAEYYDVVVWSLPSTFIVLGLTFTKPGSLSSLLFCNKAIVWLGDISFELFMFHQVILRYLYLYATQYFPLYKASLTVFLLAFIISVIISLLWRKLVTERINNKNSFFL